MEAAAAAAAVLKEVVEVEGEPIDPAEVAVVEARGDGYYPRRSNYWRVWTDSMRTAAVASGDAYVAFVTAADHACFAFPFPSVGRDGHRSS